MLRASVLFCIHSLCMLLNLGCFIHASLDKRWAWAAIYWAFVSIMLLFALSYGYRLRAAWRSRHRYEH